MKSPRKTQADYYIKMHDESLLKDENFRNTVLRDVVQFLLDKGKIDINTVPMGSNYKSFVFPGVNYAYQVYVAPEDISHIKTIIRNVPSTVKTKFYKKTGFGTNAKVKYNFEYEFETRDYLPFTYNSDIKNIIEWQKIVPFNSLSPATVKKLVKQNFQKFCWDINKALLALNSAGYIHNDTRLDNIGINPQGNFCLFDFDMTKKGNSIKEDVYTLTKSLEFNFNEKFILPVGLNDMVYDLHAKYNKIKPVSGEEIVVLLDKLTIA